MRSNRNITECSKFSTKISANFSKYFIDFLSLYHHKVFPISSILGCVLPLLEVALRKISPSFSVLCCPCPYHSLLPPTVFSLTTFCSSNWSCSLYLPIGACNIPSFHFALVTYSIMSVCLTLFLRVVLRIPSCSLIFRIFSIARWLVSSFVCNAFVKDHFDIHMSLLVWHWWKTFLFRFMGWCLTRRTSLDFQKKQQQKNSLTKSKAKQNKPTNK